MLSQRVKKLNKNDTLVDIKFILSEFNSIDEFIEYHSSDSDIIFIDINNIKRRIPDDVAIEIIKQNLNTTFIKTCHLVKN